MKQALCVFMRQQEISRHTSEHKRDLKRVRESLVNTMLLDLESMILCAIHKPDTERKSAMFHLRSEFKKCTEERLD